MILLIIEFCTVYYLFIYVQKFSNECTSQIFYTDFVLSDSRESSQRFPCSFSPWHIRPFIHSSILPSIYTQSDVSQRFSRALSILMRRLLQLFAFPDMALCSLFTCTVCWLLITRVCYTSIHWHQRWQHWACFVDPSL